MSDANLERITILLQARDRDFARAMDRNNKLVARLSRDSTRNMQTMQRQMEGSFARMGASATAFGTSFLRGLAVGAVTGAIAGITAAVRGAVTTLSALGKAARDAGIDVEQLQGLQRGLARAARVSAEEVTQALVAFNTRIGQAMEGDGQFAAIAERYGIALRGPNGELRTQSELLREVAQRIRAAGSEAERAAIANAAFGQVGRRMAQAMTGGAEALDEMVTQARAAGDIIDRNLINRAEILDDKFDALTRRVVTFFQTLTVGALAGGAETALDTLTRMFGTLERARAILGDGVFDALISEMGELQAMDGVTVTLDRIARNSDGLQMAALRTAAALSDVTSQLSDLGMVDELLAFDEIANGMEQLVAELRRGEITAEEFERKLEEVSGEAVAAMQEMQAINGLSLSDAIRQVIGLANALDVARAEARELRSELPGGDSGVTTGTPLAQVVMPADLLPGRRSQAPPRAPNMLEPPTPGRAGGGSGGSRSGYAEAVAQIQERTRALEMEAQALIAVAASGRDYGDAVEFARVKSELMTQALREGREITPELEAQIEALAGAYVSAGQAAEEAAQQMRRVQEDAERGFDALSGVANGFLQSSEAGRAALVRLIAELIRVRLLSESINFGGGGGGFFGFIGSLLRGRAAGGPVRAGVPYRINENTPNSEVMVPSRSGGVLNVAQAKDALRDHAGGRIELVVHAAEGVTIEQVGQIAAGVSVRVMQSETAQRRRGLSSSLTSLDLRGA
jgi:ribosomal protein L7/L12